MDASIPQLYATEDTPLERKIIHQRYQIKEIGFYWLIAELIGNRAELDNNWKPFGNKRHKIHLYSLKKFFFSQATAEVGDAVAQAWCGRKGYLSNYLRLPLEDRQRLYLRVMPRLTIFATEPPKTQDTLRERLKTKGLSDEVIDNVLEGLVLA